MGLLGKKVPVTPREQAKARDRGRKAASARAKRDERMFEAIDRKQRRKGRS